MYQEILGMPIVDSFADFEGEVPRMLYWHRVSVGPDDHAYELIYRRHMDAYDAGSPIATVTVSDGENSSPTFVKLHSHWTLRNWDYFAGLKDKSERTARVLQYVWNYKVMGCMEDSFTCDYKNDRVLIQRPWGFEDIVELNAEETCATVKLAGGWITFSMEKPREDRYCKPRFVPVATMILRMGKRLRVLLDFDLGDKSNLTLAVDHQDRIGGPNRVYLTEKQTRGMDDNAILDLARSMAILNGGV